MKVKERVYFLGTESGNKINPTDNLLVEINDISTKILLKSLFESYLQSDSDIKGHSFLSEYPIEDGRIMISPEIGISIINKNDDQHVYFTQYKSPFIEKGERESDVDGKINMLKETWESLKPKEEGEEIIVKVDEPEIISEEEAAELAEEITDEPVTEDTLKEYEELKTKLLSKGFICKKSGKYELLYNKENKQGGLYNEKGEKVTYLKISDTEGVKVLRVEGEEEDLKFDVK